VTRSETLDRMAACIDEAMRAHTDDELRKAAEALMLDARWPMRPIDDLELPRS
jgi:hypothetical protein